MIPFGSFGGSQSKVTEEAVTFSNVTFWGGSNGSESQGAHGHTLSYNMTQMHDKS